VQTPAGSDKQAPPAGEEKPSSNQKSTRPGEFVIAPLPISSPALGTGIVPVLGYIFPISTGDTTSPPSVITGAGLVTNNGSSAFVVGADLYFKHDTYHSVLAYAKGKLNYDLYGIGVAAGNAGLKLPLEQKGQVIFGEFLRRLGWKFFVGPRFISGNSTLTLRGSGQEEIPPPPDLGLDTNLRSLGFHLQRDTRSNRFYPRDGTLLSFTGFLCKGLGQQILISVLQN
jgi:hypothetical protein